MNIKCLIYSTLILLVNSSKAQLMTPLSIIDSLFLETNATNQLYFNYKVNKNQTLYHIAKTFQVSMDSIVAYNPGIQISLRENIILKIPIQKSQILIDKNSKQDSCIRLYYKIKPSESLYQLSKRKFEINLEKLLKINKLDNNLIREGSILKLGYFQIKINVPLPETLENKIIPSIIDVEKPEIEGLNKHSRGVAISEYDQLGSGRLFALHNTAVMDSQIEIENPVLNRKVYAKVIGRIPPIYEHDVQVIVSAEAARLLGAVDKRFFVSLSYR